MDYLILKHTTHAQKNRLLAEPAHKFFFLTFFLINVALLLTNLHTCNINYTCAQSYKLTVYAQVKVAFFLCILKTLKKLMVCFTAASLYLTRVLFITYSVIFINAARFLFFKFLLFLFAASTQIFK